MTAAEVAAALAAEPARSGLCLDFDGTLAAIGPDPAAVRLPEALRPLLADLAGRLAAVAVVSGRPAAFLGQRVDIAGVRLLGVYGLEEWRGGAAVPRGEAAGWQPAVRRARAALRERFAQPGGGLAGVLVEDKGLSVAVHWRNARDRAAAERAAGEAVAALAGETGLAVEPGKLVLELRPPVDWDKGAAVRALAADAALARVAYLGDDLGDLPAFAAARDLGGWALAVAAAGETPPALLAAADTVLDGPEAVVAFLTRLRDALAGA